MAALGLGSRPTIVLVHGAWHGSWVWEIVVPRLTGRGWRIRTVELPTTGERPGRFGLAEDAEAVGRCILDVGGPVVVVAHSYAGVVVSQGAANLPGVRHLVYVCAFQLDVGESLLEAAGGQPPPWWVIDGDVITVDEPGLQFFNDLGPEDAARATARLRPFNLKPVTQTLTAAAWHTVPSTYVMCDNDVAFATGQEIFAARAAHVRRLPSGHSPFFSVPYELSDLIEEAATGASAS